MCVPHIRHAARSDGKCQSCGNTVLRFLLCSLMKKSQCVFFSTTSRAFPFPNSALLILISHFLILVSYFYNIFYVLSSYSSHTWLLLFTYNYTYFVLLPSSYHALLILLFPIILSFLHTRSIEGARIFLSVYFDQLRKLRRH